MGRTGGPRKEGGILLGPLRWADPADASSQSFFFLKYFYLCMYLAVLGLSCNMWDLVP